MSSFINSEQASFELDKAIEKQKVIHCKTDTAVIVDLEAIERDFKLYGISDSVSIYNKLTVISYIYKPNDDFKNFLSVGIIKNGKKCKDLPKIFHVKGEESYAYKNNNYVIRLDYKYLTIFDNTNPKHMEIYTKHIKDTTKPKRTLTKKLFSFFK